VIDQMAKQTTGVWHAKCGEFCVTHSFII